MSQAPRAAACSIWRWPVRGRPARSRDELALEEPLEIRVDTRPISVTMRTPGHDEELAAGFLLSEGLVRSGKDILKIVRHPRNARGNVVDVFLAPEVTVDFERLTRHVFASSSCGLCGAATIAAVHKQFPPIRARAVVTAKVLAGLPELLRKEQATFDRTGGLHAAAVFDLAGQMVVVREDVGRHNAVDKVLGFAAREGRLPLDRHILLVSGRASFEIVQKALAARLPIVAAVSAPSSLAVEFARASGQTLVGFLRDRRMNVYSRRDRVR